MLWIFTSLADFLTYNILGLSPDLQSAKAVHFFIEDITKIFFLTALIIFVMGLFRRSLSKEKIRKYINNKPKWIAYLLAVLLGWVTPFCSCSSIPLFIGFVEAGIPLGITMTFLAVSPMPIEAIAILGSMIGFWESMLFMILCGIAGVIFGVIVERRGWSKYINSEFILNRENKQKKSVCCCSGGCGKAKAADGKFILKQRVRDAVQDVEEILGAIWVYIFIGLLVGAFLHGYVPKELFIHFADSYKLLSVPFAVVIGIPLYSNATGIIPVMEALFLKGVPLGTILTLMMSVTVLSLPEFVILSKILKKEMIIRFLVFLSLSFTIIGIMFNIIF